MRGYVLFNKYTHYMYTHFPFVASDRGFRYIYHRCPIGGTTNNNAHTPVLGKITSVSGPDCARLLSAIQNKHAHNTHAARNLSVLIYVCVSSRIIYIYTWYINIYVYITNNISNYLVTGN